MDGLAWLASLLSTAGIRLNTAYLHTTRIEFIQGAGKSLFLAYSGRIMSFWFFFFPVCLASSQHWEFSSRRNSFANSLMICILRHNMRKWERIVPPCKSAFAPTAFPMREVKESSEPSRLLTAGNWCKLLQLWKDAEGRGTRKHKHLFWLLLRAQHFRPVHHARVPLIDRKSVV